MPRFFKIAPLLAAVLLAAQSGIENFDLTGLPPKPINFAEQRLMDMIQRHRPGDLGDAAVIQQKLAEYYSQKGDTARARVAQERSGVTDRTRPPTFPGGPVSTIAGDYLCRSMGSGACDTQTTISLHEDGTWGWRYFSGEYRVSGGRVTFTGVGLGSWGPAAIGPGTLTFASGGKSVVWAKARANASAVSGTFVCATAAGGGSCQTAHPIEMRADGTWSWGVQRGSYSVDGALVRFIGALTTGPASWGEAEARGRSLIFHDSGGASEWRQR